MKRLLLLSFILVASAQGAVKKPRAMDELSRHRTQVLEMGARLSSLEKEIGAKNNLYLSSLEQIKQFEADVRLYRERLTELKVQVKEAQDENREILKSYLLESENDATEAWQRKVHLELLKKAQTKLKESEAELASFDSKVNEFDQKLADLRKDEEELSKVIEELEVRKRVAMERYLTEVEKKKKIEARVQSQKAKTKIAKIRKEFSEKPIVHAKPERFFSRPVDDYITYVSSQKGVTFKYSAVQPVKAVGGGKVVYAGDLSNYGQVVLIDHGNDLRTVLLGKMDVKVKKNDSVKDGDILAYTVKDSAEDQNLYFEVRKKNTAQNTILWLDPRGVSKI